MTYQMPPHEVWHPNRLLETHPDRNRFIDGWRDCWMPFFRLPPRCGFERARTGKEWLELLLTASTNQGIR